MTVAEAYAACRVIARREAKNFYYSFRVLPRHKSDAMCAVYAFMRRTDDLADDESLTLTERRVRMAAWLGEWRASRVGGGGNDAVFVALADTQMRFGIEDERLEELVRGTALDLEEEQEGVAAVRVSGETFQVYESFVGLRRYCYLVASVVGLVSIRVFGYTDTAAEELAEETGLAFQLTNILRDVKEDAERGRIYLPMEEMIAAGTDVEEVVRAARGEAKGGGMASLMRREGARAKECYRAAERLLPMIDRDSRAALWVMVTIYRELLERIEAGGYSVAERVRVPTWRKMVILGRGMVLAVWFRVTA